MTNGARDSKGRILSLLKSGGIPFFLSALLSASTVGTGVYWQDSGVFLAAVKELGILYPPGFVLYLLLCKAWTLLLFFVDFTLAVHLFSAACAALAAGVLGVTGRDLLLSEGSIFRLKKEGPESMAEWSGAVAGCLAASGYTFWFAGIYAKGYSFFYMVLSLLLYWMVRADGSRKPRDFTVVAVLIGLSWQAHPSAALLGIAMATFVFHHRSVVGWKGILWRTLLAAGCALGPALLLPVLAWREPRVAFGNPSDMAEFVDYLWGRRFVSTTGVFGFDGLRWARMSEYFWEETLGIGVLAMGLGLCHLAGGHWKLLAGIAAWTVPMAAGTNLFKMEGQQDHWLVAAWLPLFLAGAVGLRQAGLLARRWGGFVIAGIGAGGVAWAVALNAPSLNLRDYRLPEIYLRCLLEKVHERDSRAIVLLVSDDAIATGWHSQIVRGSYPGMLLVSTSNLEEGMTGRLSWYDRALLKREPDLRPPDYLGIRKAFPRKIGMDPMVAAFSNANFGRGRSIFSETRPPQEMVRPGCTFVPAGGLWKMVPKEGADIDTRYWEFPIRPEEVRGRRGRARATKVHFTAESVDVKYESYEERLERLVSRAFLNQADWHMRFGRFSPARQAFESALRADPEVERNPMVFYSLAGCLVELGDDAGAKPLFQRALTMGLRVQFQEGARLSLIDILLREGRKEEANAEIIRALSMPGLSPEMRVELEKRMGPR